MIDLTLAETKRCSTCREVKPRTAFPRNKAQKDGLNNKCKDCRAAYRKVWYHANRERDYAQSRASREVNPEKWDEANRTRVATWRKANPERARVISKRAVGRRRARLAINGGSYTRQEFKDLQASQAGRCAYCERAGYGLSIDHIIPVKQGGPTSIDNLCLACRKCNLSKGARTPAQWVERWYRVPKE